MKRSMMFLSLVLVLFMSLGELAEAADNLKKAKWELGGGLGRWAERYDGRSKSYLAGMAFGGYYLFPFLQLEAAAFFWEDNSVLTGNIGLNVPIGQTFSPYIVAGIGPRIGGELIGNLGAGLKVRATNLLGVRFELRRWGYLSGDNEDTIDSFLGTICFYF